MWAGICTYNWGAPSSFPFGRAVEFSRAGGLQFPAVSNDAAEELIESLDERVEIHGE